MKSALLRVFAPAVLFAAMVAAPLPLARAQPDPRWPHVWVPAARWAWYDPSYGIAARVHAQADLLRAQGQASVNFAAARRIHAEAVDKELDNWVKQVRAYWDRKIIREQKMLELDKYKQIRLDQKMDDPKYANRRLWDRLKNHPELSGNSVPDGTALNFLLARLSGSVLSYSLSESKKPDTDDVLEPLALTMDDLHAIQLRQVGRDGTQMKFRADGNTELNLEWWPYVLRDSAYDAQRRAFETARDAVLAEAESGRQINVKSLQHLETCLMNFSRQFYQLNNPDDWVKLGPKRFSQYKAAELFLRSLDYEVMRIQNAGDIRVLRAARGYDPKRDGQHLVGLLTYMARSGVDFAPALPGDEPAYHKVFAMMRDLYVLVADDDGGIKPKGG